MNKTNIGWTDFSSSPVKYRDKRTGKVVWACVKASPGCVNCYAENLALRWGKGGPFVAGGIDLVEPFVDGDELKQILTSKKLTSKRVFIEDMSDLFGPWVPDAMIDQVFAVMALRPDVTFQVLTKRADRMANYLTRLYARGSVADAAVLNQERYIWWNTLKHGHPNNEIAGPEWPLPNVLVGYSAENQEWFNERSKHAAPLMRAGWNVWVSFEPLLGPIIAQGDTPGVTYNWLHKDKGLKWAVVGGESGRGHRSCEVEWIAILALQFKAAKVPMFVKQDSGQYPGKQGRISLPIWEMKQHPCAAAA